MKTKEEIIKEAWGDLYNHGVGIDNNGWLSENYLTNDQCKLLNSIDSIEHTRKAAHDLGYYDSSISIYRPKQLQGIENNNGWIKIESEKDLPKEFCYCWIKVDDVVINGVLLFNPLSKTFTDNQIVSDWNEITHMYIANKPKSPLY